MKLAIIGAGAAGLAAARHAVDQGFEIEVFEQTGNIGGTWNYTDEVGVDEYGLSIHSSMYQGLRTNLPKELMAYENFPYPDHFETSYLYQENVLEYMNNFTKHFKLQQYIKFYTHVTKVDPFEENKWLVEFENVKLKQRKSQIFDAVFICIGHYKEAHIPHIEGIDNFLGIYKHSHVYRRRDPYINKKILVIGAGPSGIDISQQIATVANKVYLSYRQEKEIKLPNLVVGKPVLKNLSQHLAHFEDGSEEEIDEILFCTGYKYSFPFLTNNCGIEVNDNYVNPLYKHLINIQHPTMAFIGIPFIVCPFPLFDIQVRFFLSTLNNHFILPSKEVMLNDLNNEWIRKKEISSKYFHMFGAIVQREYSQELANMAEIRIISPVIHKLYAYVRRNRNLNDKFQIIDDENYLKLK